MYYSKCENYGGNLTELSSGAAIIAGERGETNCCASQYQVTGKFSLSFTWTIIINIVIINIIIIISIYNKCTFMWCKE